MTDHDILLSGLPDCRWNYMRGLADAAEDEGKQELAVASGQPALASGDEMGAVRIQDAVRIAAGYG